MKVHGTDTLIWKTLAEVDNVGFNVYRQQMVPSGDGRVLGEAVVLNTVLIPAEGSPFSGATYKYETHSTGRPALYWLEDLDVNGIVTWHGPVLIH